MFRAGLQLVLHVSLVISNFVGNNNLQLWKAKVDLKHCGRVTQICIFNTVKLGTSASSP
jgi:hypothetical protein